MHPDYDRYPPRQNPLTRTQWIAVGVSAVALVVTGLIVFWPRQAKAKPAAFPQPQPEPQPVPVTPPTPPSPTPRPRPSGGPSPYGDACLPVGKGGQGRYDESFWDAGGTDAARARIFDMFERFGYETPENRSTMNDPGPDGVLGGYDDVPNAAVRRFQEDYNAVSAWGGFLPTAVMGGLDMDGLVGPCTLNALKLISDNLGPGQSWENSLAAAWEAGY